jgi:hypothetical protein
MDVMSSRNTRQVRYQASNARAKLNQRPTPAAALRDTELDPGNACVRDIQRLVRGAERGGSSCGMSKGHKSGAAKETLWAAARQTNLKRVGYRDESESVNI